jgi:hypothetical protein
MVLPNREQANMSEEVRVKKQLSYTRERKNMEICGSIGDTDRRRVLQLSTSIHSFSGGIVWMGKRYRRAHTLIERSRYMLAGISVYCSSILHCTN